jgi:hypothetical protein
MDTPPLEKNLFNNVTCNISASIDEATTPGALAQALIMQVLKELLKFKGLGSKSYAN